MQSPRRSRAKKNIPSHSLDLLPGCLPPDRVDPAENQLIQTLPADASDLPQHQKKKKKQPAFVAFFKRIKLRRPPWRRTRSRSRSRGRRHHRSPGSLLRSDDDEDDENANYTDGKDVDETDGATGSPGAYDLVPLPSSGCKISRVAGPAYSFRLDPWASPYDFAVQGDRLLVPGLDVAEFALSPQHLALPLAASSNAGHRGRWPARLGHFVPLCIDATPGLVYITGVAGPQCHCGLFVLDRSGRLAASRLEHQQASGSSDADARRVRRPSEQF